MVVQEAWAFGFQVWIVGPQDVGKGFTSRLVPALAQGPSLVG